MTIDRFRITLGSLENGYYNTMTTILKKRGAAAQRCHSTWQTRPATEIAALPEMPSLPELLRGAPRMVEVEVVRAKITTAYFRWPND
jgi:hypothetical protein